MGVISAGGMDSELISTAAHRPRSRVRWGRGDQETPAGGVYKDDCFPCSRSFTLRLSSLFSPSSFAVLLRRPPSKSASLYAVSSTDEPGQHTAVVPPHTHFLPGVGHLPRTRTHTPSFLPTLAGPFVSVPPSPSTSYTAASYDVLNDCHPPLPT